MTAFVGTAMNIQWLYAAGTQVVSGDYLTLNYTPSVDMLDETAGGDATHLYIPAQKDGKLSVSGNLQAAAVAGGTIMAATMTEGNFGTVIWSPEGTAAGKAKYTLPCMSGGVKFDYAYSDLTKFSCDFQQSGLRVEGTN